ncbi:hypothetical protein HYC85_012808 [Camellia sinensis]|uniref:PAS domain-containing protein n=1 Tax=Camellia sinensis TaxID=4442 RepID=A0A7J7HDU6_CAMSI|nr:hypothetical protein HYC85_012808 [Camellia sinensis]
MDSPPPAEELLKKIEKLEVGHAHLTQEMSKLMISSDRKSDPQNERQPIDGDAGGGHQRSHSVSPQRSAAPPRRRGGGGGGGFDGGAAAVRKRGSASVRHSSPLQRENRSGGGGGGTFNPAASSAGGGGGRTAVKNRAAEHLYGYSATEALGQDAIELLTYAQDFDVANNIVQRVAMGESWTGQFPVKNKKGDRNIKTGFQGGQQG